MTTETLNSTRSIQDSQLPLPLNLAMENSGTQDTRRPTTQQTPLQLDKRNEGWGDLHQYVNPQNHFRVVSKNVSTLNPQSLDMVAIATELSSMQASLFCAQETNTAWNPTTFQAFKNQCKTVYPHHKLAVSSSKEKNEGWFQPGGTGIVALGAWASHVIGWG